MITVAIADDEKHVRINIRERLRISGADVELVGLAANGKEALQIFSREKPDIFFVDINMPGIDGLSFIESANDLEPEHATKFIIISGYDDFHHMQKSIRAGVNNYILKPISQVEFNFVIKDSIQHSLQKKAKKFQSLHAFGITLFSEFINDFPPQKSGGIILIRTRSEIDLSEKLSKCYLKLIQVIFSGKELKIIAFPDNPNILMLFISEILSDYEIHILSHNIVQFMQENMSIYVDTVFENLKNGSLRDKINLLDNKLNLRFSNSSLPLSNEVPAGKISDFLENFQVDFDVLETIIEGANKKQFQRWVNDLCENLFYPPQNLMYVRLVFHKFILLLISKYFKYNFDNSSNLEKNLQPFALVRFDSWDDIFSYLLESGISLIEKMEKDNAKKDLVDKVATFLRDNYQHNISLTGTAEEFFISPTYLSMRFKEKTKMTFTQYLEHIRMEKAKEFLQFTTHSISEISRLVGYEDASYFARVFHRTYHISPRKYRIKSS